MCIPTKTARFAPTTTYGFGAFRCSACTTTSLLPRLVAPQPLWSHLLISLLDHDADLDPIHLDVEVDTEPATNADVRRTEEPPRIGLNQHLLGAFRRRQPHTQTIIVVMVGSRHELLAADEPRRLAVAELFGDSGQRQADLPQALDLAGVRRS